MVNATSVRLMSTTPPIASVASFGGHFWDINKKSQDAALESLVRRSPRATEHECGARRKEDLRASELYALDDSDDSACLRDEEDCCLAEWQRV